ncbi:MAG TPA: hypothetical protein VFW48_07860, partial [Solirubrobacterales bacterium]|nr:hypothetical protein [Solirubrobacterales bacterium]
MLALALVCAVQGISASGAHAAPSHAFDATLSLTGGCGTTKADPVADPGLCPMPPGVAGVDHPSLIFRFTIGATVDSHGNVYVASGSQGPEGLVGLISIFSPTGKFLTQIEDPKLPGPLAVDSQGVLYVSQQDFLLGGRVLRYTPSAYPPTAGTTYSGPTLVEPSQKQLAGGIAVNRTNDHLLVTPDTPANGSVREYSSAAEGNALLREIGGGTINVTGGEAAKDVAVNAATGDIFVAALRPDAKEKWGTPEEPFVSGVYVFGADGKLKTTIDGSDTPAGGFRSDSGKLRVAVDEASGEVFVTDLLGSKLAYRFVPDGEGSYEYAADPELESHSYSESEPGAVAVVNHPGLPNSRNVYITSTGTVGHLYAFTRVSEVSPPAISGTNFSNVTDSEAILRAELNPNGAETSYYFEYVEEATFEDSGFAEALSTPEAELPPGSSPVTVSAALGGLSAETKYRFRLRAASHCDPKEPAAICAVEGEREEEGKGEEIPHAFATYPVPAQLGPCANEALRVGPSAALPDCRAYERVSPLDTGSNMPSAASFGFGNGFASELSRGDGEAVFFEIENGSVPGSEGNGFIDRYEASRDAEGWRIELRSPNGAQSEHPYSGGVSADHGYAFWRTGSSIADEGSFGPSTTYLRRPDGSFELLGQGNLGVDLAPEGRWISYGASHVVFTSAKRLEEGAQEPQSGTTSERIYDRTPDGTLHVVSLLPGDATPSPGATVTYKGVSADGATVAFTVTEGGATTLYLRIDNSETVAAATGATTFAGLSANGSRLTYLKGGDVFSYDTAADTTAPVGSGGESTVVNVSADGSHVYFVSPQALAEGADAGKENLFVWEKAGGTVELVATLTKGDVVGEKAGSGQPFAGLGLWTTTAVAAEQTLL